MNKKISIYLISTIALISLVYGFDCFQFDGNQTGCQSGNASTVCEWKVSGGGLCDPKHCPSFTSNATCSAASQIGLACQWTTDQHGSFCRELHCGEYATNSDTCENSTVSLGLNCTYFNGPPASCIDNDHKAGCSEFNNQQSQCLNTNFCKYNLTTGNCDEPTGFSGFLGANITCNIIPEQALCLNMTGCAWNNGQCGLPSQQVGCPQINDTTVCNDISILPNCCTWNVTSCLPTFETTCWDNKVEPPQGAFFCEDYNAIRNQSMCDQIAGSPWYMPCTWSNKSTATTSDDRCEFNHAQFFAGGDGGGKFEDIDSKSHCEAAGGVWRSESYTNDDGTVTSENWCEMSFGAGTESCDSSCWACETQPDGSSWANQNSAQAACEASQLGFCKWRNDTNAPSGLGFCEKPAELLRSGCGLETTCADYEYYANPIESCNGDEDCRWVIDVDNPVGYCGSANVKTCAQNCGQCFTQQSCLQNGTSCEWDSNSQLCKSQSNGEICFNGVDDDNDGMVDCADSGCFSEVFCGGGSGVNCFQYESNATCSINGTGSCIWVNDTESGASWCDVVGSNCWLFDDDNNTCEATNGCSFKTDFFGGAFCDANHTIGDSCIVYDSNQTLCTNATNCTWISDPFSGGGFCEHNMFTCEQRYFGNQTGCDADTFCNWTIDPHFAGGGRCEGICFGLSGAACDSNPLCHQRTGLCEPTNFAGGGCFQFDGYQANCTGLSKCSWTNDPFMDNDSINAPNKGWCNDGNMIAQFEGMEGGEPVIVAEDAQGCGQGSADSTLPPFADICGIGIKDMKNSIGLGFGVANLSLAMMCNNKPLNFGADFGQGGESASYYLYLDSDGNDANSCNSSDNAYAGFEFFFKYETSNSSSTLSESRVANRCVNGTWATVPIPINTWVERGCNEIGGAIMALDKETLESYDEFNKSANFRMYGTTNNVTGNASYVIDSAGPGFYKEGSVDFVAEDCRGIIDLDGDGCLPSEDPDCMVFNQFGFVPFEDCRNGVDDNYDGKVDCDDEQCKYDQFACGGTLEVDPNDNTPPSLAWSEVTTTPDGAFIDLNTYEPSNASVNLYVNQTACNTINATIVDSRFVPWHAIPIDNFAFNPDRIGFDILPNTTYLYKYKLCDISDNCLVSACLNFTTKTSYADCGRSCATFLDPMDFTPPPGSDATDPTGYMLVQYDTDGDGDYDVNKSTDSSSTRKTLNETRKVNIKMTNPNSSLCWAIECINGTIPSTVSFNSSSITINQSIGDGLVGMPTAEYVNKFIADFACKAIRITVPQANNESLFNCANSSISGSALCSNVTNVSILVSSANSCNVWEVNPSVVGFSFYSGDFTQGSSGGSSGSSGGSSGGGGGSGGSSSAAPSSTENFVDGVLVFSGEVGQSVGFSIAGEDHTVKIQGVRSGSVDVIIRSVTIRDTIALGETKSYDLTEDGSDDLSVRVDSIENNVATLSIVSLVAPPAVVEPEPETTLEPVPQPDIIAEPEQAEDDTAVEEESRGIVDSGLVVVGILAIVIVLLATIVSIVRKHKI